MIVFAVKPAIVSSTTLSGLFSGRITIIVGVPVVVIVAL